MLHVPRGVTLEAPLFSLIGLGQTGRVDLSHTLVVLEEGAEATLVLEMGGQAGPAAAPGLHVGALEVFLGQGARLRLVNIQNWDDATWHFSRERAIIGRDASLQWTVGGLGSRLSKVNQEVALAGQGAKAQVNGVMFTTGRQHLAYFTRARSASRAPHNQRPSLQSWAEGQVADCLEGHDPRRERRPANGCLSEKRQPRPLALCPCRLDPGPRDRGRRCPLHPRRRQRAASATRMMLLLPKARGIPKETAIQLIVEGFFANVYDRITITVRSGRTLRQAGRNQARVI